jgi:hypothetical protein
VTLFVYFRKRDTPSACGNRPEKSQEHRSNRVQQMFILGHAMSSNLRTFAAAGGKEPCRWTHAVQSFEKDLRSGSALEDQ